MNKAQLAHVKTPHFAAICAAGILATVIAAFWQYSQCSINETMDMMWLAYAVICFVNVALMVWLVLSDYVTAWRFVVIYAAASTATWVAWKAYAVNAAVNVGLALWLIGYGDIKLWQFVVIYTAGCAAVGLAMLAERWKP